MTIYTIDAATMDAAALAQSTEGTLYYLCGVRLDPRGFVVATNGHVLFCGKEPGVIGLDMIVPSSALAAAKKGKGEVYEVEHLGGENWRLTRGTVSALFSPVDGSFPDWQRAVPVAPIKEAPAHIDPTYYGALGKMAGAAKGKAKSSSAFEVLHDPSGPCPVIFDGRKDWFAVVMPMRREEVSFSRDAMLTPPEAPQVKAA